MRENPLQLRHHLLVGAIVVRRHLWVPPEDLASEVRVVMPYLQQAIYVASGAEIPQSNLLPVLQEIEIPSQDGGKTTAPITRQQTTGGAAREYGKKGPLVAAMCVTDDAQSNGEETGRTSDGSITVSRRTWSMPCSTSSCLSRAFLLFSASLFKSSMARQINQKAWWANSPEDKVDRHCRGAGAIS